MLLDPDLSTQIVVSVLFEKSKQLAPFLILRGAAKHYEALLHELAFFESADPGSGPVAAPTRHTYSQNKQTAWERNHRVAVGSYPVVGLSAWVATNGQPTNRTTQGTHIVACFPSPASAYSKTQLLSSKSHLIFSKHTRLIPSPRLLDHHVFCM